MALKEAIKHIKEDLVMKIDPKDTELLRHVAETSLSSKLIGPESKFFSEIVVNAITSSKIMVGDTPKYSVKNINILKTHGKSVTESRLIDGYAIESTRGGMGMPLTIKNAKIALLDMNLAKFRMPPGVHIMVDNPDNLENVRQREMDVTKERCRKRLLKFCCKYIFIIVFVFLRANLTIISSLFNLFSVILQHEL